VNLPEKLIFNPLISGKRYKICHCFKNVLESFFLQMTGSELTSTIINEIKISENPMLLSRQSSWFYNFNHVRKCTSFANTHQHNPNFAYSISDRNSFYWNRLSCHSDLASHFPLSADGKPSSIQIHMSSTRIVQILNKKMNKCFKAKKISL
jgi:hypothetical protein